MKKGDDNTEREPTKEELEAEFDLNDEDLKHAATRIQACFRGHVERKKIEKKEDEEKVEVDIDEITKKVSEELGIDLADPELNKAATKIQATFRGHKTRVSKGDEGASN